MNFGKKQSYTTNKRSYRRYPS